MVRYLGRSLETITVPNKPIPKGYKVWVIADRGFFLRWIWHKPGEQNGPVGMTVPIELGGNKPGLRAKKKKGNKS
jgi:hypothetical protein